MTPTEKDAMALDDAGAMAVLATAAARIRNTEPLVDGKRQKGLCISMAAEVSAARAHLASRIAELEETREVLFGGLDRDRDNITTRNLAVVAINALARERDRATRAEAELAAVLKAADYFARNFNGKNSDKLRAAIKAARGGE